MIFLAYALLVLATLVTAGWCVHYHFATNGGWWATDPSPTDPGGRNWHGRNFMALAAVLALMLGFTLVARWLPYWLLVWVSVVLYAAAAIVMAHRHYLLWTSQRRRKAREAHAAKSP